MSAAKRQRELLAVLCCRRYDTYDNLAFEFGVSRRTICRDIAVLMCDYPIETVRGRYGGGVKISDGQNPYHNTLTPKQTALLIRLKAQLDGDDLDTMKGILLQFAP